MTDDARRARFEEFFQDYYDTVLAYAASRADLEVAKDAVAATFLVAWRRHGEKRVRPLPWLYGITRKTLADQWRSRDRFAALGARLAAQPPSEVHDDSDFAAVREAIARLRPIDQEILRLSAWEEVMPDELGEALGTSRRVAIVRLHRARQRLKRELERYALGDESMASRAITTAMNVVLKEES